MPIIEPPYTPEERKKRSEELGKILDDWLDAGNLEKWEWSIAEGKGKKTYPVDYQRTSRKNYLKKREYYLKYDRGKKSE